MDRETLVSALERERRYRLFVLWCGLGNGGMALLNVLNGRPWVLMVCLPSCVASFWAHTRSTDRTWWLRRQL